MADRFMQQDTRPSGAEHDLHFARRSGDGFEVGQRLRERDIDRAIPFGVFEQATVKIASAEPAAAGGPFAGSSSFRVAAARSIAASLISLAWAKAVVSPVTPRRPKPDELL